MKELSKIKVFDQCRLVDSIEKQLVHEPLVETRNRKMLIGLAPSFESVPPVWELRVGDYRVFYDLDAENNMVYVRAVRHKPPHATTEEIL